MPNVHLTKEQFLALEAWVTQIIQAEAARGTSFMDDEEAGLQELRNRAMTALCGTPSAQAEQGPGYTAAPTAVR